MADELIASDPAILSGKPCICDTRLSVEFLLELVAGGATRLAITLKRDYRRAVEGEVMQGVDDESALQR
jgi:uncharacterized protein (DUF433 family)